MKHLLSLSLLIMVVVHHTTGIAVMSIDFGSEWMKIGIVSPGVPMEIALNKESKRKTPTVISFRDNMRSFGEDAQTVGIKFPDKAYFYLLDLLAKDINHPLVKLYKDRFPYYEIVADEETNTILFKHDEDTYYSVPELIAQLLRKAKEFAEQSAHQPIKECVMTVPGYFNQAERKALLQASQLADIKVLQLINDYMAVSLNYGIFRTKDFNETAQYVMFYDMGASSTSATIVSLQNVKTKERGYVETHPQISIIGVGFDRTLGGLEMQLRLRDFLGKKFNEMKKTKNDVFKNPRAMAKLFKEAGRVKNVLSANTDHYAQIEGLLDDQDFRTQVTREDFEDINKDVFDRVSYPVEQALKTAGLSIDIINQVVLVGAGTRVPKVQEKLQEIVKMELAKNLNTDEAAAMGAVYKAADLSTGFQVKKFITKDAVLFPIQVAFQRETDDSTKHVKRMLFGLMNHFPQKKIITFNKHNNDFFIDLNYAELDYLKSAEISNIGTLNLSRIELKGVADALKKNKDSDKVESKGIKAHFHMDESGILSLVNVEFVFEKQVLARDDEDEGAFSKLGSTISKLFSGKEEEKDSVKEEDKKPVREEEPKEAVNKTQTNKTEEAKNANATVKDTKPKVVTIKEPIKSTETILSINLLNKEQLKKSQEKLKKLNKIEFDFNRRAGALNNLESFVVEMQTKLYEDEYASAGTEEEIEKIRTACSQVSDWLYEEGSDAAAEVYETKLDEIKGITNDLMSRVYEHRERPEALSALNSMLNSSRHFLDSAKNLTKSTNPERDVFTDIEIEALEKLITESEDWVSKTLQEQKALKNHEPVKLTVKSLVNHMQALDREMKYLVNKLKIWKPKKPIVEETNKTAKEAPKDNAKTPKDDEDNKEESKVESEDDEIKEEILEIGGEGEATKNDTIKASEVSSEDEHTEL